VDGNGRARAKRTSSSDDLVKGWSNGGEMADLGLPPTFAAQGARAAGGRARRARGSAGRRVDGGRPPARRRSGDGSRAFEAELGRVAPPPPPPEPDCVIEYDLDDAAPRSAGDRGGRWLYRATEVGELLGCTGRYVKELVRREEIRAVRIGRLVRIPAAEVEAFVARRLAGVAESARPALGRPPLLPRRPAALPRWDALPPNVDW
jgi:excisionase family DNA binding protein